MNSYNLQNIENTINKIHPMNLINKVDGLAICLFKTTIEYVTARKNKRQRVLYFIIKTHDPQYSLDNEIKEWMDNYNLNKDEHKQISNAIILESLCEGFLRI